MKDGRAFLSALTAMRNSAGSSYRPLGDRNQAAYGRSEIATTESLRCSEDVKER